uniref:Uncharacterized protein n=1 Tax=viral metagenome TaxID=1070528 RepID=A0A6C0EH60_9ZZZZ
MELFGTELFNIFIILATEKVPKVQTSRKIKNFMVTN